MPEQRTAAPELTQIRVKQLALTDCWQSRVLTSSEVIEEYAEALRRGEELPPIDACFDGKIYWPWDGLHRGHAHVRAKRATMWANVIPGDRRKAQWLALSSNDDNRGFKLTIDDRKYRVRTMLTDDKWYATPHGEIAKICRVHLNTVKKINKEIQDQQTKRQTNKRRKVERNGTTYEMDTTNIGGGTAVAEEDDDGKELEAIARRRKATCESIIKDWHHRIKQIREKGADAPDDLDLSTPYRHLREFELSLSAVVI
jgi:uncharacterized ParB-like nuclease family protein